MRTAVGTNRTTRRYGVVVLGIMTGGVLGCEAHAARHEGRTLLVGFVGAAHGMGASAARGAQLGAEEAARTGALLGRGFVLHTATATDAADAARHADALIGHGVTAIVGGFDDATCAALDSVARARHVVYLNIGCRSDHLRAEASAHTFHIEASDAMYARDLARATHVGGAAPVLWHGALARYGAAQLNQRFVRRFGTAADASAWAAWMSMKVLWEASTGLPEMRGPSLAKRLLAEGTAFDGHKGEALHFDPSNRQLRQPLVDAPRTIARGGAPAVRATPADTVRTDERRALARAHAAGAPLLVVTSEGSADVQLLRAETGERLATLRFAQRPRGVQVAADGRRAWIALSDEAPTAHGDGDVIAEVDLTTGRVVARHDAGSDPEQFAVARDGRLIVVANEDAGTATLLDPRAPGTAASLLVGIEPEGVALSPDGRVAYVTAETSNTISVIDTRRAVVVASFLVDERPRAAAFAPDGARAYVTNEISGTLSVIDAVAHRVVGALSLANGRARPVGVVVAPDGRRVYIANGHANTVSVVDAATLRETALIPVGRRPWGIAVAADGSRLYVANGGSDDLSVIDTSTQTVVATYAVGERPWGVAVTPGARPRGTARVTP